MNPWLMLGAVLALVAAVAFGHHRGYQDRVGEEAIAQQASEQARKEALQAAAAEIAKIDVKNVTIQGKVIERIRTEQVYSDCKHSPESWKLIQEAYQP
jgi:hypothetical protein